MIICCYPIFDKILLLTMSSRKTPQRSDSVKKPKIKLNTSTPKGSNGAPKGKDASVSKEAKSKTKLSKEGGDKKSAAAKETKMTPEERHARKEASHVSISSPPFPLLSSRFTPGCTGRPRANLSRRKRLFFSVTSCSAVS